MKPQKNYAVFRNSFSIVIIKLCKDKNSIPFK